MTARPSAAYVNAAYLNGANFLEALNYRMGDDAFFRFLQDYTSRYGRGHATAYDFFAVARQNTTADISDLIDAYFAGKYLRNCVLTRFSPPTFLNLTIAVKATFSMLIGRMISHSISSMGISVSFLTPSQRTGQSSLCSAGRRLISIFSGSPPVRQLRLRHRRAG